MARYLTGSALLALLLGYTAAADAQAPSFELRAGVVVSTPLVDDVVADPLLAAQLGLETSDIGAVRLRPAPSPMLAVAAAVPLQPRLSGRAEVGWTFASLAGSDGIQEWDAQDLGIGHATLGLRYDLGTRGYLRGGLGLLRMSGEDEGLFEGGAVTEPTVEAGAGADWAAGPGVVSLELVGQAHSFGTEVLRRAGGRDGTIYRLALRGGVALGGRP